MVAAAAFGVRPVVLTALHDPDPSVRAEATRQAIRLGWAPAGELLADAPPVLRRLILRVLRRRPLGSGDTVIDQVRERHGDREAALLLPACTPPVVARLLPGLAGSIISWKALARRHSATILDWAAAMQPPDWTVLEAPLRECAHTQPARVLDLLERHTPDTLPQIDLAPLAAVSPSRVAALVIGRVTHWKAYQYLTPAVLRRLRDLDVPGLVAINEIATGFMEMLPPRRRAEVYAAMPHGDIPNEHYVALLPEPERLREVRRVLALPQVAADEHRTRSWSEYLPAAEVLPMLDEAVRDPDPYTRSEVYRTLLRVAGREPAALPEVLRRLQRLRNERETVRRPVLEAMSPLVADLDPAMAPALTAITDAAIEARDSSPRNQQVMVDLAYAALAARPHEDDLARWALGMIARLPIPIWVETIRPGHEHLITAALHKRITADAGELLDLVRLLENRARHVPEIQQLLRLAAAPGSPADIREEAARRWLDDPRTRSARAASLLREDPGAARLAPVWREIAGHSTDLLDTVLHLPTPAPASAPTPALAAPRSQAPASGAARAATTPSAEDPSPGPARGTAGSGALGPVSAVQSAQSAWAVVSAGPPSHVRRWTPRQQHAYAHAASAVAADTGNDQAIRIKALRHLARVPVTGRELLGGFLDAPEIPVAEAAIGALPWTDRPGETLPVLLGYAGGDRARVALPATDRAARFVGASTLLALLRGVLLAPETGVTSRKAAIRLLARYGPPEHPNLLAEVWHAPGAHPDVRAVVLTALRKTTPLPWDILTAAASSTRAAVIKALLAVTPDELPETDRPRFAALVVDVCRSPQLPIAREAFDRLAPWLRWAPGATGLVIDALTEADHGAWRIHSYSAAVRSLVEALLDNPEDPDRSALESLLDRLAAQDRDDPRPGSADYRSDRPARRRLARIAADAAHWARSHPAADVEPVRSAARRLAAHPTFLGEATELLTALAATDLIRRTGPSASAEPSALAGPSASVEPSASAGLPTSAGPLAEVADLVAARPALTVHLAAHLAERLAESSPKAEHVDDIVATGRRLADRTDLAGGLFALALVTTTGKAQRWPASCEETMHLLRHHPNPDVADAAYRHEMTR